ncbi:PVC-type heme-binding CxxCH protein [Bremerella cremea]|nr:PVC-type heme-binding CxxCH protein [Bremerella cremea]
MRLAVSCLALAMYLNLATSATVSAAEPQPSEERISILFLGDNGHHQPAKRFVELQPALEDRGIDLKYTDSLKDINPETLAQFDGLMIYANSEQIDPETEKALIEYVEQGHGLIPLHCASYCFLNSPKYVDLVGAQFQRHGTGTFRTKIAEAKHPIMKGFQGFESWDETYVHTKHNEKNRTVLTYRVSDQGKEPWTWVREQGDGRVFYTAWGHDSRTWTNPGFQNLVERGVRWAVGKDPGIAPNFPPEQAGLVTAFDRPMDVPETQKPNKDVKPFDYVDVGAKIPNYTAGARWGTQEEPMSLMQKPLSPEESQKHLVLPEGFEAKLFASEEIFDGGKPIAMTWDAKGRLWMCMTLDYPNELHSSGPGRDRIVVCEDTDGDLKADKVTTFAEGLSIPTGIAFHDGGLIVQNGTETLFLKDTDGDDVADEKKVIFTGWNMRDTHGGVSNFQYGHDNWIWGMQGYNDSHVVVQGEEQPGFRNGFFRFKPDGSKLEFIRSTDNNTWGLGISEEGIIFGSTANGCPSVYMPIPNRYYENVRGWTASLTLHSMADTNKFDPVTDKVRQVDHHGGYTAGAGHSLYTARNYPEPFWNRVAFVNGPTGHLTGAFVISRHGSDFSSTNSFNLVASDDEWTAPIQAEVGPDGNVWVLDWYNYIVQHNPTPHGFQTGKGAAYETDLRDKRHGRIYRIVYTGEGAKEDNGWQQDLTKASPEELVATLKNDNLLWRRHAQQLLVERGETDVVPALIDLLSNDAMDSAGLNVGAIHALWTLKGLGALEDPNSDAAQAAYASLKHKAPGVRRNAVQVLPISPASTAAILNSGVLNDVDPQVRLMTLLALADQPASDAAGAEILAMLSKPENFRDRWIPDAATSAAANQGASFLKAVAKTDKVDDALLKLVAIVTENYARSGPTDTVADLIPSIQNAQPQIADAIVNGLSNGWPKDKKPEITAELDESLATLSAKLPPSTRGQLVRLAVNWGSEKLASQLKELVASSLERLENEDLNARQVQQLAREIVQLNVKTDPPVEVELLNIVGPQTPGEVTSAIFSALGTSENDELGTYVLEVLPTLTPAARKDAISLLLGRPAWTNNLLSAMDSGEIQLNELALDQRQALSQHPDRDIRKHAEALFMRGGALPNADRQKVIEELWTTTEQKGDPAQGKLIFKRECSKCHVHSGEGSKIGPDLTGMAVHPKSQLLTEILDPNRSVESNYRTYMVATVDGRVMSGLLASESRTAIELIDAEGKKQSILREDIDELRGTPQSLMPVGFEKQIKPEEFTDLLAFLTQRGKYVPVPLEKVATIVSTQGMFNTKNSPVERMVFDDWKPKTVDGVPFQLVDPEGTKKPNVILLNGPQGSIPPQMPKQVSLDCNMPVKAVHILGGVGGWASPLGQTGSTSMIVRLTYEDGTTEDHPLKNGVHIADYIRRIDVPESKFAFDLQGRQVRYLAVHPERQEMIKSIDLIKGDDQTAPVVMAVTLEAPE